MELAARDDFDAKNCFCLGGGTVRGLCSLDQSNVNLLQFPHFDLFVRALEDIESEDPHSLRYAE